MESNKSGEDSKSCEEPLRDIVLFSLEKRRDNLIILYNYLKEVVAR